MAAGNFIARAVLVEDSSTIHRCLTSLIVGLVIGFSVTQILNISTSTHPKWIKMLYSDHTRGGPIISSSYEDTISVEDPPKHFHEHTHSLENSSMAQKLYREVRVLCWVMTGPKNHRWKAMHVKRTWGKRCNKLLFMSSVEDKVLGTVRLNVSEGRDWLWAKTKEAFKYIYENHFDDADWFYKADDDTYAIMENMRYMLYPYSPDTPIYFGAKFKTYVRQGYMSGGAGYVLSKEAIRRFVTEGLPNPKACKQSHGGFEDVEIGKCMQKLNVTAGDSRDSQARGRFFPFPPASHLLAKPNKYHWYWNYIYYKTDEGLDCCSDYSIAFHYIGGNYMYNYEYLIYHLRPYGIVYVPEKLPKKLRKGATLPPPTAPRISTTPSPRGENLMVNSNN